MRARTRFLPLLFLMACDPVDLASCPPRPSMRRAFLTDVRIDGSQVRFADSYCAQAAGFVGRWKAWVSRAGQDAIDAVEDRSPWYDAAGRVLFGSKRQLLQGPSNPVILTAQGRELGVDDVFWTGTGVEGRASLNRCSDFWEKTDWSSTARGVMGDAAVAGLLGERWAFSGSQDCDKLAHLLCLEQ